MSSDTFNQQRPLTLLQERFLVSGFTSLNDQETIELLLSLVLSCRESKRLATECIKRFKNLRGFLTASSQELERAEITPSCIFFIKLLRELPAEVLKQKIVEQPVYKSSKEILNYLSYSMRDLQREIFKVVYLNNRNQIIDAADLFEGTLDGIPIRPREIVESAMKHAATGLIFAHNHPSGDPTPSKSDKQLTRDLIFIGMILQIKVLDHIIIGDNSYVSFADEGLIKKCEDEFLNLRIRGVFDSRVSHSENLPSHPHHSAIR